MARILIADDHAVLRDGLRLLLQAAGHDVVGEARDGREALQEISRLDPDIVVMDIGMPIINGLDALRRLTAQHRRTRVLLLSMYDEEQYVREAIRGGAWGYVLKGTNSGTLLEAVKTIAAGRHYFTATLSEQIRALVLEPAEPADPLDSLSSREREVLRLVLDGKTSAEIARLLFLSTKTVETYRSRLMQKLHAPDLVSLVKYMSGRAL